MAHLDLLAAAFSAMLGVNVVSPAKGASLQALGHSLHKLTVHELFRATHIMNGSVSHVNDEAGAFNITVKSFTGEELVIPVTESYTVADLKAAIHEKNGI